MSAASEGNHPSRLRRLAALAAGGLGRLLLLSVVLALAATYVPSLLGFHRYVLVGESMEPTIHRGSLVFDDIVPVEQLRKGDIVTYIPPGLTEPMTHRIISMRTHHGERVFRTKGDNNKVADPGRFSFRQPQQARVRFSIPYVGWLYIALTHPGLRIWLVAVPAFVLAFWCIGSVWREGGRLVRERAALERP